MDLMQYKNRKVIVSLKEKPRGGSGFVFGWVSSSVNVTEKPVSMSLLFGLGYIPFAHQLAYLMVTKWLPQFQASLPEVFTLRTPDNLSSHLIGQH